MSHVKLSAAAAALDFDFYALAQKDAVAGEAAEGAAAGEQPGEVRRRSPRA